MASIRTSPCDWSIVYCGDADASESGATGCSHLDSLDAAMQDVVEQMAIDYLWHWTGKKYGLCPIVIRPCRQQCWEWWSTYRGRDSRTFLPWVEGGVTSGGLQPALIGGDWYNFGCGGDCNNDPCSCSYVPTVDLFGPVESVSEVLIDGVVLAASAYRVDNHRFLIRTDGGDWPTCQDMTADPLTDEDTFQVTFNLGVEVPAGGQVAAGILACQFARAACDDGSCKLPKRVQSVVREGVTMTLLDDYSQLYQHGTTGIWLVDSWVASVNANKHRGGIRVSSPDRSAPRRET